MAFVAADRWMGELVEGATDVARAMGLGSVRAIGRVPPPRDLSGVYLPIVGRGGDVVYVGWLASSAGCEAMARALLGGLAVGPLSQAEILDAMGEIVNIVAGAVMRRMRLVDGSLALGLPIRAGSPLVPAGERTQATRVVCGGVDGVLVLVGNVGAGAREAGPRPGKDADD